MLKTLHGFFLLGSVMSQYEIIFGYGSLMSAKGLKRNSNSLEILDAYIVRLKKGSRGFAKPSQNKNKLSMDIDDFELRGGIPDMRNRTSGGFEGLALEIPRKCLGSLACREGYGSQMRELIRIVSHDQSLGDFLQEIFEETPEDEDYGTRIREYRIKLHERVGKAATNYIPHPLDLGKDQYSIVFIASSEKYGTGSVARSKKECYKIPKLMKIDEAARIVENKSLLAEYYVECIFGGVHGINLRDVLDGIKKSVISEDVNQNINCCELLRERNSFNELVFGLDSKTYIEKFGSLACNLKRSGLEDFFGPFEEIQDDVNTS